MVVRGSYIVIYTDGVCVTFFVLTWPEWKWKHRGQPKRSDFAERRLSDDSARLGDLAPTSKCGLPRGATVNGSCGFGIRDVEDIRDLT
jgi:hypothetical protein